jgi:hypothetical protein
MRPTLFIQPLASATVNTLGTVGNGSEFRIAGLRLALRLQIDVDELHIKPFRLELRNSLPA